MAVETVIPAAAITAGNEIKRVLDFPVIGVKRRCIRQTKKRVVITEQSFQMRGWEAALLGVLGVGVVISIYGSKFFTDIQKRVGLIPKPPADAKPEDWNKYYIDRLRAGYTGWIPGFGGP